MGTLEYSVGPDSLLQEGDKLAKAMQAFLPLRQVVNRFERGKETVLGEIRLEIRAKNEKMPVELIKSASFADPRYKDYLGRWDHAEGQMIAAQVEVETCQNRLQALQSYFRYKGIELTHLGT